SVLRLSFAPRKIASTNKLIILKKKLNSSTPKEIRGKSILGRYTFFKYTSLLTIDIVPPSKLEVIKFQGSIPLNKYILNSEKGSLFNEEKTTEIIDIVNKGFNKLQKKPNVERRYLVLRFVLTKFTNA
ncbi:MAG: hypothetical protein ACKPFF_13515, partial [Planktothrix sp.]